MPKRMVREFLKCEQGTQMIEFAFLLPFLILLFAASVEMGRMFYTYTTLQKSVEVGARYLSRIPLDADTGQYLGTDITTAKSLVVCGKVDCTGQTAIANNLSTTNITVSGPTGTTIKYVTVSVGYDYQPRFFNLANLTGVSALSLNFTFTPSIKMRYLP